MAGNPASARLTRELRRWLTGQVNTATVDVARMWRVVNLDDLDGSVATFTAAAAARTAAEQQTAADAADLYVSRFLGSELDTDISTAGVSAAVGRTSDGRPVEEVMELTRVRVAQTLVATRSVQAALDAGEHQALRAVRTETMDAFRQGEIDALESHPGTTRGWRRDTAGGCGVCLALADGVVERVSDLPDSHPSCMCFVEPVAQGVTDTVAPQTGQQMWGAMSNAAQDALFEGKGGAMKAALIRSGQVSLADLVVRRRPREWRAFVQERPLAAL